MSTGTLYIVATPIGNLGDITLRAIETLKSVDAIAAEDTRHTLKLLNSLHIKNKLISFFEHSPQKKAEDIVALLEQGQDIALVSDAGMPIISDPGAPLTALCAERGIKVTCIPGACAAVTALALSAIPAERFIFEGFLSKEKAQRRAEIEKALKNEYATIIYESPHAIKRTLEDISKAYPDRQISVCRELTKIHEEVIRGSAKELSDRFSNMQEIKGEFVVVISGFIRQRDNEASDEEILNRLKEEISKKKTPNSAIAEAALWFNVNKNRVYKLYTDNKDSF